MSQINLDYKGKKYVLEYTRETVKTIEKLGFSFDKYSENPMTQIPIVFNGAFLKNHKFMKNDEIQEIYDSLKDKQKLMEGLLSMISDCYTSLMDDSNNEGNATWEIV